MSIVNDIITFYKSIGAYDELGERDFDKEEMYGDVECYESYLLDLIYRYDVEYENHHSDVYENILDMESMIDMKFKEIMRKKL